MRRYRERAAFWPARPALVRAAAQVAPGRRIAWKLAPPPAPPKPAPPKPAPKTLEEIHAELIQRIQPVVEGLWPAEAPIQTFDLAFNPQGMDIHVDDSARRELDKVSVGLLQNALRDKLAVPTLTLDIKRVRAVRKPAQKQPAKSGTIVHRPTTPK
ncbi:MAG TPA: hypothetical protein VND90_02475 [Terracidiphilus sp.]|nr:hypothetical protein [Terracidiphilus sp.]